MPGTYVDFGRLTFGGLAQYFAHDVPGIFTAVKDAQLQSDLMAANANAIRALKSLDAWFASQRPKANENFALGADLFHQMLYFHRTCGHLSRSAGSYWPAGSATESCALKDACAQFAPGKTLADCTAKQVADKPQGSSGRSCASAVERIAGFCSRSPDCFHPRHRRGASRRSALRISAGISHTSIFPVPMKKVCRRSITYRRPIRNGRRRAKSVSARQRDPAVYHAHEVWPGHFLQFLHANRVPSRFGQVFVGYAFAEGWAHYSEEMMWDAGLGAKNPEIHVGQLMEALLRNVRFLSAIGMHTGRMSVAHSEKMFREIRIRRCR